MNVPRVSFGLPVFNGERYLAESLDSVLRQDEPSWELVISDNGSTDGTEAMCRELAAREPRVRYLRQPTNRGGHWNFQHVLDEARASYFCWLAADDRKTPTFASSCLAALDRLGPETVMAYTRTRLIDADGGDLGPIHDDHLGLDDPSAARRVRRLLRAQASPVFYGVIRTEAVRATRGVRPCVATDMVLLAELACLGRLVLADGPGLELRMHEAQASAQGNRQMSFYRPSGAPRFAFQNSRVNAEILSGVAHSDLALPQKARTWLEVWSGWILPRWRAVVRDLLAVAAPEARPGTGS